MRSVISALVFAATAAFAEFPQPYNTEPSTGGPMPPDQAAASVRTPPGFHVTMFAAEPDVQQPIAMATDSRGRLWVVECYTYAEAKVNYDTKLRDRIVIFEDTKNSGHFDKRTVFWDQGERLTSIELGFGGVWVTAAPNLLFIPDKNGDDIPDGPPEVVLDGWDYGPIRHNIVNGLRWGPDGWLYGRHGILATSLVGAPGTPAAQRTKMNVGIWRYHPTRKVFEVVANGGTNPWGMDWNEVGEAFFTNTVTGHLWHLIPGAHYERMYGEDANPHVYQLMPMCADHYHFDTGAGWTKSRAALDGTVAATSDALGGGHAHCGCLIYQGEQWPEYWRGKVLMINFHGRRLNVERLERSGSGYVAKHEPDAFFFGDPWFRGIDLIQAPDGGVFVADWSDASECHDNDGVHRTSGRIYKITYGDGKSVAAIPGSTLVLPERTSKNAENPATSLPETTPQKFRDGGTPSPALGTSALPGDIAALSDEQLVQLQLSKNEWLVRTARRALRERAAAGTNIAPASVLPARRVFAAENADPLDRLHALLALNATGTATLDDYRTALANRDATNRDEYVNSWAVRLLADDANLATKAAGDLAERAKRNSSQQIRLTFASVLPRLSATVRDGVEAALIGHQQDDAADAQINGVFWNALCDSSPAKLLGIAEHTEGPIARWATRRLTEDAASIATLGPLLEGSASLGEPVQTQILLGIRDALRGVRKSSKPDHWDAFAGKASAHASLATQVRELSVIFGDGRALDEIRAIALDAKAEIPARRQALQSLIDARTPDLRAACEQAFDVRDLAGVAARGLANFDDPKIGTLLVQRYGGMYAQMRPDAIGALVSRPAWAVLLLDAIANGQIARTDLDAYHARQIRAFNDDMLTKRLAEVWGDVRGSDEAKQALMAKLKTQLTPDVLAKADVSNGRALFTQTCAVCHKLYGEGATLGPDLTGSARDQLSYLVENIADPSAIVPVDFRLSIVTLKDGRVLTGFVGGKTERGFTLRGIADTQTIERAEVKEITDSPQSLMPEGILSALNETQVRDLFGYLQTKAQVPLPAAGK